MFQNEGYGEARLCDRWQLQLRCQCGNRTSKVLTLPFLSKGTLHGCQVDCAQTLDPLCFHGTAPCLACKTSAPPCDIRFLPATQGALAIIEAPTNGIWDPSGSATSWPPGVAHSHVAMCFFSQDTKEGCIIISHGEGIGQCIPTEGVRIDPPRHPCNGSVKRYELHTIGKPSTNQQAAQNETLGPAGPDDPNHPHGGEPDAQDPTDTKGKGKRQGSETPSTRPEGLPKHTHKFGCDEGLAAALPEPIGTQKSGGDCQSQDPGKPAVISELPPKGNGSLRGLIPYGTGHEHIENHALAQPFLPCPQSSTLPATSQQPKCQPTSPNIHIPPPSPPRILPKPYQQPQQRNTQQSEVQSYTISKGELSECGSARDEDFFEEGGRINSNGLQDRQQTSGQRKQSPGEQQDQPPSKKRRETPLSAGIELQLVMLLSLVDGGGSSRKICDMLDMTLCCCLIGEYEHNLRRAAGGEYVYSANNCEWCLDDHGIPTAYILDVWGLSRRVHDEMARIVGEAIGLAIKSVHKYFVIGGAPCPDLTFSGKLKGLLGFTGPVSVHYHVFHS